MQLPCASPTRPSTLKTPTSTRHRAPPISPLSARRTNIPSSPLARTCTSSMLPSPPRSPPDFLAPKRPFKQTPLMRSTSGEEGRNARRNLFLKKVQSGREEAQWKARGGEDEIMRMIFVAEQKRWEASLEKAASRIPTIYEEEEQFDDHDFPPEELDALENAPEMPSPTEPPQFEEVPTSPEEFDEYLDRDGQELEDLLSQMEID